MRSYPIIDSAPLYSQETSMIEQKRTPLTVNRRIKLVNTHLVASSPKGRSSSAQTVQSSSRQEPSRTADVFCDPSPQTPSPPDAREQHRDLHLVEGPLGMPYSGKRNAERLADDKNDIRWPLPRKTVDHRGKGNAIEAIMDHTATICDVDVNTSGVAVPTAEPETRNGHDQGKASPSSPAIRSPISPQTTYQAIHSIRTEEDPDFLSSRTAEPVYKRRVLSGTPVPMYRNSWTPNNAFRPVDGGILTRRHSFNNLPEAQNSTTRKLDLRVEMAKRRLLASSSPFPQSRANSVLAFNGKTAPIQRRRASSAIADEDRERIEILGMNTAIDNIARASGFHVDQIWRVYDYYGSVKRTEEWVRLYQRNSARLQELTHEQMMKKEIGGTLEQQETFSLSPLALAVDPKTHFGIPKPSENQLKMKLLPPDSLHLSVGYSPPQETRAGEYNRLVFQGRTKEAISREHARASGNSGVFPRIRSRPSTSMSVQSSSGGETLQGDVNRIREESDVAEQLLNDGSADSGHQSGLTSHEEMVLLSAHGGITAELQRIEKRMGSDYMLQWLASRLSEIKHRSSS
ncbi:hypothetical protein H0H93_006476 [Arthromyces matolae]|nr:hypothetical protein H0H93_006476 [Arthromyces matolae]